MISEQRRIPFRARVIDCRPRSLPRVASRAAWPMVMLPALLGAASEQEPPVSRPDQAQQAVSRVFFAPVRWADRVFGETIANQETNRSYLRVASSTRWSEGGEWDYRPVTRLKLDFSRTLRRLSLLVAGRPEDTEEDLASSPDDAAVLGVPAEPNQNNSFVGLNQRLTSWISARIDLRAGVRAGWHPFGQLRYRQDVPLSSRWLLRFSQTGFWIHDDGVGSLTRIELDRPLGQSLLRLMARGTIEEFDGFKWSTGTSMYTPLSSRLSLSLDLSMLGVTDPRSEIIQYRSGTRLRFAVRPRWWFVELEPELAWPLASGRHATPAVTARMEIVFGWAP